MNTKMTRYTSLVAGFMLTLALSANAVLAQEDAVASSEATGNSIGIIIAILAVGLLVILGLGLVMNVQAKEENSAQE